jgi:hypothetical protein
LVGVIASDNRTACSLLKFSGGSDGCQRRGASHLIDLREGKGRSLPCEKVRREQVAASPNDKNRD